MEKSKAKRKEDEAKRKEGDGDRARRGGASAWRLMTKIVSGPMESFLTYLPRR